MNKIKMIIASNENSVYDIDLARLYQPISRVPKIKNELIKFIDSYIYEKGIESISKTAINVRLKIFILFFVINDLLY